MAIVLDIDVPADGLPLGLPRMVLVVAVVCAIVPYVLVRGPLYLLVPFPFTQGPRDGFISRSTETGEEMKLKTGPTRRVHANNTRGAAFCGLGAFVGVGKTQRATYTRPPHFPSVRTTTRRSIRKNSLASSRSTSARSTAAGSG